jgi:hypothetical protein
MNLMTVGISTSTKLKETFSPLLPANERGDAAKAIRKTRHRTVRSF